MDSVSATAKKKVFPCGQSKWKGYSVVLSHMRGIWYHVSFQLELMPEKQFGLGGELGQKMKQKPGEQGPFFPWPAPSEGWKRLLSNTLSNEMHQSRRGAWPGLGKWRVDVTRRGRTRTHVACLHVCVEATHQQRRVGVDWILMCRLGKTLSLSLLLYLLPSEMCSLLSCEHTARIKSLFISLCSLSLPSRSEKDSFTQAPRSNSHSSQFISYCQLELTGSLWESRCLSLMLRFCGLWGYAAGTVCHVPACRQWGASSDCASHGDSASRHTHAHTCRCIETCLRWLLSSRNIQ